jgi:hypothetical protein
VCGASNGSAFSAEVVVSATVLVDFGGDFRASRGGGGGRLLAPNGVGIVMKLRRASAFTGVVRSETGRRGSFRGLAKLLPLSVYFAATKCCAAEFDPDAAREVSGGDVERRASSVRATAARNKD